MFISVEFNAVAFVDECTIASSGEDASVCMNLSHPIQTYQNHFLIPVIIVQRCSFYSRFNNGLFVRFSLLIYPRFQEPNRTEKSKLNQIRIYIYLSAFYFPILQYPMVFLYPKYLNRNRILIYYIKNQIFIDI